ncbi:MAG: SLC13 family permease [Negativicutes bacterium]
MSLALMSLIALLIAIAVSCFLPYNVGLLSIAFAFIVGGFFGGLNAGAIIKGFPVGLFIILAGVTYLFGIAQVNGTLEKVSSTCIRLVRGRAGLIPIVFFVMAFFLSVIGPGAIPSTALLAPPAMVMAQRLKINPLLMALFVCNGANSAALSPITPSGAIAAGIVTKLGMPELAWTLFWNTLVGNVIINIGVYLAFGGLALWKRDRGTAESEAAVFEGLVEEKAYDRKNLLTLLGIAVMLIGALVFKYDVGLLGITVGVALTLLGCADEGKVIKAMPWGTLLMVCGVTVLISLMSTTGGMKMFIDMIASISTPKTLVPIATFIPGLISAYSSTTGVVFPAFLPLVPDLVKQVGGNVVSVFSGMTFGGTLVDASPLSTLGALAIAAATPEMDKQKLFKQMLAWGLSMSVVGALIAWVLF